MSSRIIIAHTKYGPCAYEADDYKGAALRILGQRVHDGYWYEPEAAATAKRILDDEDGVSAWRFLLSRSDAGYEYEGIELVSPQ